MTGDCRYRISGHAWPPAQQEACRPGAATSNAVPPNASLQGTAHADQISDQSLWASTLGSLAASVSHSLLACACSRRSSAGLGAPGVRRLERDLERKPGLSREELLELVRHQQEELAAREAAIERRDEKSRELEEDLSQFRRPVKTPENSSVPPSRGQKAN